MNRIACIDCRQCNRKGKPSVSRFSAYCDAHVRKGQVADRIGLLERFKNFVFEKRFDEKQKGLKTTRGFRPVWFER